MKRSGYFATKNKIIPGNDYLDEAIKILYAADICRHAIEMQEKCRALPENTPRQLDSKTKKLANADKRLASIKEDIKKLKWIINVGLITCKTIARIAFYSLSANNWFSQIKFIQLINVWKESIDIFFDYLLNNFYVPTHIDINLYISDITHTCT